MFDSSSNRLHIRALVFALTVVCLGLSARAAQTGFTGSGLSHQNHQPGLGINYLVATQGIYPSRSAPVGGGSGFTEPFVGEIKMFAGNFAPRGYAFANGQLLPISSNTALFSLFGTIYGGDGRTTFALPDLRGRSAMHQGTGPGLPNHRIGEKSGSDSVALNLQQIPSHNHTLTGTPSPTSGFTGGGQSHTNMKPYQAINYFMPFVGSLDDFGAVRMAGFNFAPSGHTQTDGQLLPIASNTALFSVLGTTYGGDGRTTFALPDLRGRLTMHEGTGPGLTNRRLGAKTGVESVAIDNNTMPSHTHTANFPVNPTGGGQAHFNMQPTNTLNYVIALTGLFPSRNGALPEDEEAGGGSFSDTPFIGEIRLFAGNFAPQGWAFTDGQTLSIASNQALFSLLGTNYGGDGRTTFGLPDLRSRVPVHVGGSQGSGPGLRTWRLGEKYGEEEVTLTDNQLPRHRHFYCNPGDTDDDGDIDTADLNTAILNFTGAGGSGKDCFDGDTDEDGDVDTTDLTYSITNFTGAMAGNANVPDLVYDPATGNVTIDADGADVISFSLQSGPFNAADFSELPAGLTDNIASQIGWTSFNLFSGLTGTADLGAILPAGLDLAGLEAALTTASYGLALAGGGGGGRLDLIIPEPASLMLMAIGGAMALRRRQAA